MYLYIVNNLGIKGRVPSKGNVVAACNLEDKNNDSAYAPALADNIVSTLIRIGLNAVYVWGFKRKHMMLVKSNNTLFKDDITHWHNYEYKNFTDCVERYGVLFCASIPSLLLRLEPLTVQQYYVLFGNRS